MAKIIDGKKLAADLEQKLKLKIATLKKRPNVVTILVGENQSSEIYTNLKQKKAQELRINFTPIKFSESTDFETVVKKIQQLNSDQTIQGIMVQLPLPDNFLKEKEAEELLKNIDPKKDIDGLTGQRFIPATVKAVTKILKTIEDLEKKSVAVIGSRGWVGSAIVFSLRYRGINVLEIDKKIEGTELEHAEFADIVISCAGVKDLIKPEHIKEGAILIDVGLGDFDPDCFKKAESYTPKIGGVGPVTIISLMENIIESA